MDGANLGAAVRGALVPNHQAAYLHVCLRGTFVLGKSPGEYPRRRGIPRAIRARGRRGTVPHA
jgi:hypothetical protein